MEYNHAVRIANLSLLAGQTAGRGGALRDRDCRAVREARHPASWLLDGSNRRIERRPLLHPEMGFAGRAPEEIRGVSGGSGLDRAARQERGRRPANRVVQQFDSDANQVFGAEVDGRPPPYTRSSYSKIKLQPDKCSS